MPRPRRQQGNLSTRDLQPLVNGFLRLDRRTQAIVVGIILLGVFAAATIAYLNRDRSAAAPIAQSPVPASGPVGAQAPSTKTPTSVNAPMSADTRENLLLGNPSNASANPEDRTNYLLVKPYFTLSYNEEKHTANWVSWRVTAADLGESPRKREFDPENALPPGYMRITHQDYSNSGFDRGHMCPHSDRAANQSMSYATFVLSNIVPQAPNQNQKAWRELEEYARMLVREQGKRLYIVAGPNGQGGRGKNGPASTIGRARVVVPAECWKVIVAVPESGQPISPGDIPATARVIAVVMPNDNDIITTDVWSTYRVSPAEIERRTGYHFFTELPPEVAQVLRNKVDDTYIPPPKPKTYGGD